MRSEVWCAFLALVVCALAPPGAFAGLTESITGTISDAGTGAGIDAAGVLIYDDSYTYVASAFADATGVYTSAPLPVGTYYLHTTNTAGYLNEAYDDLPCLDPTNCFDSSSTPVHVSFGSPAIADFALDSGGRIAGTIADADTAAGIDDAGVEIYDQFGLYLTDGDAGAGGVYTSNAGLPAGTYYVRTFNSAGYLDEVYDDHPCEQPYNAGCNVDVLGNGVTVILGETTNGIDFALDPGGQFAGSITDAGSGAGIEGATARVYDQYGLYVTEETVDASGAFMSRSGLPAGTYYVRSFNSSGYFDELYDDLPCPVSACTVTTGTPVSLTAGAVTGGIDFALEPGGRIAGTITGAGVGGLDHARVDVYDRLGDYVGSTYSEPNGSYLCCSGLSDDLYYVKAVKSGYLAQVYQDLRCSPLACDVTDGTGILVFVGDTTSGIDLVLDPAGRISGTIVDASTGESIPDVSVSFRDTLTSFRFFQLLYGSKTYLSLWLPVGEYYVYTHNTAQTYIDELHADVPCLLGCPLASGTPVAVTAGVTTPGIDFALDRGGHISGSIIDALTGIGIDDAGVKFYDVVGNFVDNAGAGPAGDYRSSALPSGTYYVETFNYVDYLNELYDDRPCASGCDVTTGTSVTVEVGVTTTGVDFALEHEFRIFVDGFESGDTVGWTSSLP